MASDTTLVIIGGGGDLASRLLLPALGDLIAAQVDRRVRVVGAGQSPWDDARWATAVHAAVGRELPADRFQVGPFVTADATDRDGMQAIIAAAGAGPVVLYFAVPPAVTAAACRALHPEDLPAGCILALEKPFGSDAHSAGELNAVLRGLVPEEQIFRVDHFLGRSTVLNVLGVRFANRIIEPVWSADNVAAVSIVFDETLALEGRAGYYDRAGALEDMIQSHLLQVLAVVAMEPPATLDEADFRSATAAALRATRVWGDDPVASSRRARYTAGTISGRQVPDYADEKGVDPHRETETLAEIVCAVDTARWSGVPFTLRSGKALGDAQMRIDLHFRPVRHLPRGFTGDEEGGLLRFWLGPDRMECVLNVNGEGDPFRLHRATLAAELGSGAERSYTEVLGAILDGDATLSVRGDAAVECWRIIAPVQEAWRAGAVPLQEYAAGSHGPADWPEA